jgi:uncharacterized protein YndB with AHSA1/START domain
MGRSMDQHAAADEPPSPIDLAIDTDAPPSRAWATLTEPRLVAEWFTAVSPLGRVGDSYRIDFGDGSVVTGVVTEVEPGRRLAYTWMWVDAEPHEETLVAWSVDRRDGGGSSIRLVHDGWGEAGLDEAARDDHEGYWTGYLEDLAAVLAERS